MQLIINTIISFAFSAIIAIATSYFDGGFSVALIRPALYDFFIVQIFLAVLEIYLERFSKERKFLNEKQNQELVKQLVAYKSKPKNLVTSKLISLSLEECIKFCKLNVADSYYFPATMVLPIINLLTESTTKKLYFCSLNKFAVEDINIFDTIIVFYDDYTQLYRFFKKYEDNTQIRKKLLFYRRHEDIELNCYYIFDNKYVFVKNKEYAFCIYSDTSTIEAYIKDFDAIKQKSVPWGKTQGQDSLFKNQSIKEFYGDGNVPNIYLEKMGNIGENILDLGTGAGRLLSYFTDSTKYHVIALDKDETALKECKKNYGQYSHISFIWDEFTENSFGPNQFDLVIAFNSLYHTDRANILKAIKRVKQILKPGGYFLLTLKTLEGNEMIYQHAGELVPEKPENTFINTDFPDYYLPHHFCDIAEIEVYLSMFSKVVFQEEIPFRQHNGDIVQGRGFLYILQK